MPHVLKFFANTTAPSSKKDKRNKKGTKREIIRKHISHYEQLPVREGGKMRTPHLKSKLLSHSQQGNTNICWGTAHIGQEGKKRIN